MREAGRGWHQGVKNYQSPPGRWVGTALIALLFAGCAEETNQYAAPPPPEVTVANPRVQDVTEYAYFTGQTAAKASVEIRARVKGFLQEIHFQDGQFVHAGDLLFAIDPREYEAAVAHARAELLNAQTALDFAENNFRRIEKAGKAKAIAELEVIKAKAERDKAKADVAAAGAALQRAELDLSYTSIKSPIDGRVSRRRVDVGNLVGAEGSTVLTDVVGVDPVYVYVSISERDVVRLLHNIAIQEGIVRDLDDNESPPFDLALATEEGFPHHGRLNYLDNRVDPETGTIEVRGEVPNPDYLIIPGLFARIRVPVQEIKGALLVPERALGVDQAGRYLLVLDGQNVVERRPVVTGDLLGTLRVVRKGLAPDDRVVVKGILRARPGSEVKPVMTTVDEVVQADPGGQGEEPGAGEPVAGSAAKPGAEGTGAGTSGAERPAPEKEGKPPPAEEPAEEPRQ